MNKGISMATGDIIGILNSDDFLATDNILELIAHTFEHEGCDAIFGNLDFVASNDINKIVRRWKSSPFKQGSFSKGWHSPHPTFYVKREIYNKYGMFDISLNVSADFEIMLRFIERYKISTHYLDNVIIKMRYGGESTGSLRKIIRGNRNIIKAFEKNGIKVSPFYPFLRLIPKFKEFIIK
jgi:glycosyltransferase involved in cell wall biosynthesis